MLVLLRYIDPKNPSAFVAKHKEKYWMPVDLYVGGRSMRVTPALLAFCTRCYLISATSRRRSRSHAWSTKA